jgi:hypothetical protein
MTYSIVSAVFDATRKGGGRGVKEKMQNWCNKYCNEKNH